MVQFSSRAEPGQRLLDDDQLDERRECSGIIETELRNLYALATRPLSAVEIEFEPAANDFIAIKQARPWFY